MRAESKSELDAPAIQKAFTERLRAAQLKSDYGKCLSTLYAERLFAQARNREPAPELMQMTTLMSMPAFRLLEVAKLFKLVAKVVKAYLDYKYPQFAQSA